MEWIHISKGKLKVMLSAEDARRYELDCKATDAADLLTQKALRSILSDLKEKACFDAAENRIYVQMFPSKEGGCELFITKTGAPAPPHTQDQQEKCAVLQRPRRAAFRFESASALIALCRRLSGRYMGESEAWVDNGGTWWLLLTAPPHTLSLGREFPYIAEYARSCNDFATRTRLPEHGKRIAGPDAVERLGRL